MKTASFVLLATMLTITSCAGSGQTRAGLEEGAFLPCPDTPNCVSSMDVAGAAAILPFGYEGISREAALENLLGILETEPRSRIISVDELDDGSIYVHAEFRSAIFRFVDDVEFLLPAGEPLIQVKSASRLGYSDMGVNRKRVEGLRERFGTSSGSQNDG